MQTRRVIVLVVAAALASGDALAQQRDDTARKVDPRDAAGYEVPPEPPGKGWLWTKRVVLFPLRAVVIGVMGTVRGAVWVYDEYDLKQLAKDIFFNETGTVGLFPLATIDTDFGVSAGARFVHRDLFGNDEDLRVDARYGGRFRQTYKGKLSTGELFGGRLSLELEAEYGRAPESRFFGIGNRDVQVATGGLIDASASDAAVETRFRADSFDGSLDGVVRLSRGWTVSAGAGFRHRVFGPRDAHDELDAPIETVYDTSTLVGYDEGLATAYGEVEATYDTSTRATRWHSGAVPSAGWTANASVRYAIGVGDDPANFARYRADLERYIDLYGGDRVLTLRLGFEGVSRDLGGVPFVDLPVLGGARLRGYESGRFRDRYAAVGTAQYTYPIIPPLAGYLFVDAGRVMRDLADLGDGLDTYRVGFGGGLQLQSRKSLLASVSVASSIDGGLVFSLRFDPVFHARPVR